MARGVSLFIALALLIGSGKAQEKFTIKTRDPGKGDTEQVRKESTSKITGKVTTLDGKKVLKELAKDEIKVNIYRGTVLEKPEGANQPTKLRRIYEKAQIIERDKVRALPYEGKTVLIEKKGDQYRFQIEGGEELTGTTAAELESEFNRKEDAENWTRLLMPKTVVSVGDSWTIDGTALGKQMQKDWKLVPDSQNVKATGALLKAYRREGKQFGVLDFTLELPLKESPLEKVNVPLDPGSKIMIRMEIDACIDGSDSSYAFKFSATGDLTGIIIHEGTPRGKLFMSMEYTANGSQQSLPR